MRLLLNRRLNLQRQAVEVRHVWIGSLEGFGTHGQPNREMPESLMITAGRGVSLAAIPFREPPSNFARLPTTSASHVLNEEGILLSPIRISKVAASPSCSGSPLRAAGGRAQATS